MVAPFKAKYPQYKKIKFVFNFQGSPTLVQQIEQGAPADLFAGAITGSANSLLTDAGGPWIKAPRFFCQNTLCVIVPAKNPPTSRRSATSRSPASRSPSATQPRRSRSASTRNRS